MRLSDRTKSGRHELNTLLEERLHRRNRGRRVLSITSSLVAHLGLTAAIALAPALAARDRKPIEYVQVQIVPLQALGIPEPPPPSPPAREPIEQAVISSATEPELADSAPEEKVKEVEPSPERPPTTERAPREQESSDSKQTGGPAQRRGSPFGSPLATSPFGTAVAGFDNPDFAYGYYIDQMLALIGSNWIRPPVSGDVEMMIHFRIQSDGRLSEIEIVTTSGDSSFDLAGLRAVRLASPLPPLPKSFPHASLGVNLIIR